MANKCNICPRNCNVDRAYETGLCGCRNELIISRAAPHFGEEPCITGTNGSGAIFFSGCNMHCVFCQNREISFQGRGQPVSIKRLSEIFSELEDLGVHNINLVTPTHFTLQIIEALKIANPKIPVVWNTSAYEKVETLKKLEGLVQVYLPDFKYSSSDISLRYSSAPDYPKTAKAAIEEMYRQTGDFRFDDNGILQSGVMIRHLVIPSLLENTFEVIDWVSENFPKNSVLFSLMSQFTPLADSQKYPEIARTITALENASVQSWLEMSKIENGYFQELGSATTDMIPEFDNTGINKSSS